jgi:hypothetical protein
VSPLPLIDVHTHMYLPRYVAMLRERQQIPRIASRGTGDRLIILPDEDAGRGRRHLHIRRPADRQRIL